MDGVERCRQVNGDIQAMWNVWCPYSEEYRLTTCLESPRCCGSAYRHFGKIEEVHVR